MLSDIEKKLIEVAREASKNSRAILSNYRVGAAILTENGKIYRGCNIEFDNYSNTIHAEESAISSMIVNSPKDKPICIAVYTQGEDIAFPCGMCRQSLFELGGYDLKVIGFSNGNYEVKLMKDLLPLAFKI